MAKRERNQIPEIKKLDAYYHAIEQHALLEIKQNRSCFSSRSRTQQPIDPEFLAKIPEQDSVHRREFVKHFLEQAIARLKVIDKDITKQISRAERQHWSNHRNGVLLLLFTLVAYPVSIWATYEGRDAFHQGYMLPHYHNHSDGSDDTTYTPATHYWEWWMYTIFSLLLIAGVWGSCVFINRQTTEAFNPETNFQLDANAESLLAKLDVITAAGTALLADEKDEPGAADGERKSQAPAEGATVSSGKPKALIAAYQTLLEKLEEHAELQSSVVASLLTRKKEPSLPLSNSSRRVDARTSLLAASDSHSHLSMSILSPSTLGAGYDHRGANKTRLLQLNKGINDLLKSVEAEFFPTLGVKFGQRQHLQVVVAKSLNNAGEK